MAALRQVNQSLGLMLTAEDAAVIHCHEMNTYSTVFLEVTFLFAVWDKQVSLSSITE